MKNLTEVGSDGVEEDVSAIPKHPVRALEPQKLLHQITGNNITRGRGGGGC